MCKADYIRFVKEIISNNGWLWVPLPAALHLVEVIVAMKYISSGFWLAALGSKQFDIILFWYIITITYGLFQRCQTPPAPPTGCSAPPPRIRHCRAVPGQQFLRSLRFNPGQVRDAATGRGRTD